MGRDLPSPCLVHLANGPTLADVTVGADCHEKEHEENDRDVDQDRGVYDDEEDGEDPRSCLLLLVVVVDEEVHGDQNNDDDGDDKGREEFAVGDHDVNDNVGAQE